MESRSQLEFLEAVNRDWKLGFRVQDGTVIKVELVTPLVEVGNMVKVGFNFRKEDKYFKYLTIEDKWVEV